MPPSKPMTLILLAILYTFFLYHAAIKSQGERERRLRLRHITLANLIAQSKLVGILITYNINQMLDITRLDILREGLGFRRSDI